MIGLSTQHHKIVTLLSSALLLAAAFWWPAAFFWCAFLFLLPLFYYVLSQSHAVTFIDGCMWGGVFWFFHWYGVLILLVQRGNGSLRIGIFFILLFYCALFSGVWFWLAKTSTAYYSNSKLWVAVIWVVSTWLYFSWMRHGLLLPFDLNGYCFANPVLALAVHRWLVGWTTLISSDGLLLILICLQGAIAFLFVHKDMKALIIVAVCAVPFLGVWAPKKMPVPAVACQIGYLSPPHEEHPMDQGQVINEALEKLLSNNRSLTIIIMPESSFPLPLDQCAAVIQLWQSNALSSGVNLLIGCHKSEGQGRYNCCYCVDEKRVTHLYDKIKLMPFTEYVPWPWSNLSSCSTLFMRHKNTLYFRGRTPPRPQYIGSETAIELRICSELFFCVENLATSAPVPIVCLVNDSWFAADYMRTLMLLFAKLAAIEYQRHLVYVSHYHGVWLTPDGRMLFLARQG